MSSWRRMVTTSPYVAITCRLPPTHAERPSSELVRSVHVPVRRRDPCRPPCGCRVTSSLRRRYRRGVEGDGDVLEPERLSGAVWGHLVGDAMGVPYEFRDPSRIGEVRWGDAGTHGVPAGTWSDDG